MMSLIMYFWISNFTYF